MRRSGHPSLQRRNRATPDAIAQQISRDYAGRSLDVVYMVNGAHRCCARISHAGLTFRRNCTPLGSRPIRRASPSRRSAIDARRGEAAARAPRPSCRGHHRERPHAALRLRPAPVAPARKPLSLRARHQAAGPGGGASVSPTHCSNSATRSSSGTEWATRRTRPCLT
jgi:hypothetical protein